MGPTTTATTSSAPAAPPPAPPRDDAHDRRTPAEAKLAEPTAFERLTATPDDEPPDPAAMNGATAAAVNGQQHGRAESLKPLAPVPTNAQRAAAGFLAAQGPAASGATPGVDNIVQSAADMVRNAPPGQQAQVANVVEHLGIALNDGRLVANDALRKQMHIAATALPGSNDHAGALNHLTQAARNLANVELAPGTALAFDPQPPQTPQETLANQRTNANPLTRGSGAEADARLPKLDVTLVDADLYYRADNGAANKGLFQRSLEALGLSNRDRPLTLDSAKTTVNALVEKIDEVAAKPGTDTQVSRQQQWQQRGTPDAPREFKVSVGSAEGFHKLMTPESIAQLRSMTTDPNARTVNVGDRSYSVNELEAIRAAGQADVDARMAKASKAFTRPDGSIDIAKRNAIEATNVRAVHGDTAPTTANGHPVGQARPALQAPKPLPPAEPHGLPGARQGGLIGGAGAAVVSTATALADGKITGQEAKDIAVNTGTGAALGAVSAKAEQVVTPAIQRAVASRAATSATTAAAAQAAPSMVPTLASRVAGSTVVGAVVSAGVSAYHNREGLKQGDSKAIGNVTADTVVGAAAVGAGAVAGAMATGALAGSVVPGLGTAVGAVVGLGIGVAITYGAQVTGARDWAAGKVADGVDAVKNAASSAWSGLKGVFS